MKIVEDKRTLNAMKKANLIKEPKYCSFPRVDEVTRNQLKFTYKGKEFRFKYFEGNFYPYLIEV